MYKQISSAQNPEIKSLLLLQEKARERKKMGLFVVEGIREISLAISGGFIVEKIYFTPALIDPNTYPTIFDTTMNTIAISAEIYQKIAYRSSTEGIIALVKTKEHRLQDLKFNRPHPLILVAESTEKPGNIGALLRTADAAGLDAVILAQPSTDLYNPNIIRSSVGGVFTNNIAIGTTPEVITFLQSNQIQILSAALTDSAQNYLDQNYTLPTAIVVGTEATGLSDEWLQASQKNIIIPMNGTFDSMNVSVSAAVILFEAVRQRL